MRIEMAKRIDQIPPYLFAEIDKKKEEMRKKGIDLIDLGIGDPDLPTPKPIIERLKKAAENPKNHRYPSYEGMIEIHSLYGVVKNKGCLQQKGSRHDKQGSQDWEPVPHLLG